MKQPPLGVIVGNAHICEYGFEHHVAINLPQTASAVHEALTKYVGWDV